MSALETKVMTKGVYEGLSEVTYFHDIFFSIFFHECDTFIAFLMQYGKMRRTWLLTASGAENLNTLPGLRNGLRDPLHTRF